jgi:hypothetical protein
MSRNTVSRSARLSAILGLILAAWVSPQAQAQRSPDEVWTRVDAASLDRARSRFAALPGAFTAWRLDRAALDRILARAPLERTGAPGQPPVVLIIPMPGGRFARFGIEESPIMEPALAAGFPEIRTFQGRDLDDPTTLARFDWTDSGFHAMVLAVHGTVYVDPFARGDTGTYISYFKQDLAGPDRRFVCLVGGDDQEAVPGIDDRIVPHVANGATLRTYRLALAATGEYTSFYGGTVGGALSGIVTTLNRINGIYRRDLAVTMTLVANNASIVYTNGATDPYSNGSPSAMLSENQANLDTVIGSANYDIGHVFGTGGGGIATLNSPCSAFSKARGVTGLSSPIGDSFDVDYVAHEMGHQFGGRHTFNGSTSNCGGNRSSSAAYETGSGATIQSYSGICGAQNLQNRSHDFFHVRSLEEMVAFVAGAGSACALPAATGNALPAVSAGPDYTIPQGTPFTLRAAASDANGDALTYTWEEYDLGPASPPDSDADGTARPILRPYPPSPDPSRTFPHPVYIRSYANVPPATYSGASPTGIGGITCPSGSCIPGEILPAIERTMLFQVTVRDNNPAGGAISTDTAAVTVAATGPFRVTTPNTAVSWLGGSEQAVTWDVNGTDGAPVAAAHVAIRYSTDGGATFPITIAASTPNDGAHAIDVPNVATAGGRVKVEAVGNVFFDMSDVSFMTSVDPDLIGLDGVECDCLDNWSVVSGRGASSAPTGDLSTSAAAALHGSFGIRAQANGVESAFVQDDAAGNEARVRVRFMVHPNGFDPGEALGRHRVRLLLGLDESPGLRRAFAVVLRRVAGAYAVAVRVARDDGTRYRSGFFTISNAPHAIELDWRRSAAEASSGSIALLIDGTPAGLLPGFDAIDNDTLGVDALRMGLMNVKPGAAGAIFLDRYEARRQH